MPKEDLQETLAFQLSRFHQPLFARAFAQQLEQVYSSNKQNFVRALTIPASILRAQTLRLLKRVNREDCVDGRVRTMKTREIIVSRTSGGGWLSLLIGWGDYWFIGFVAYILPMPGFVEVRPEAEPFSIANQPFVDGCLDLKGAIRVFGVDRISADIKIERATGKVRTVDCQTSAASVG